MGCNFLLQEIFPTHGLNLGLPHYRQMLYCLSHQGSQILIAKFRLKLKKVGNTIRPFRYDLNQIPYDYIVEVTNRHKGLDLIDGVPEELWTEVHNTVLEVVITPSSRKRNAKRQNGCLRRHYK